MLRISVRNVIASAGMAFLLLAGAGAFAQERQDAKAEPDTKAKVSDALYVSCWLLPVHQAATAFSPTVGAVGFGVEVTIIGQDTNGNEPETKGSRKLFKNGSASPVWVKIRAGSIEGYVPRNTLVSPKVLNRQDPNQALRKVGRQDSGTAGHGFSENEDKNDLVAMKGAGGAAKSGDANFDAIDTILAAPAEFNPVVTYMEFRKVGKVGEFKTAQ